MSSNDWDIRYADRDLVWGARPNRFVERELTDLAPGRALDLASGEGRNAIWLAQRGWQVTALDFSQVATDRALELAAAAGVTIDARTEDVLAGGDDPEVDLVLISYLQLPAYERARALRRGAAAVVAGGTFLLVAHDLRNHGEGYGGPRDAGLLWTVEEVVEGLGPSFEVIAARIEERPVDGAPRPALDTLVRARKRA